MKGNPYLILLILLLWSCGKEEPEPTPVPSPSEEETPTVPSGTVAGFKRISLPLVNPSNGVIPNLAAFYVTNDGPYVQIARTKTGQEHWSVHKYQGGVGTPTWSSFDPDFVAINFMPTNFTDEREDEFSIYWCNTQFDTDRYGMYNLNNGSPSFTYDVPADDMDDPYRFSQLIPAKKGFHRLWGIAANDIWAETAVAVPKTFEKITSIPVDDIYNDFLRVFFADPDDETVLWCASNNRLYEVSTVSASPGGPKVRYWDFSMLTASGPFTAIIKAKGSLIVQYGNRVYKQDGESFSYLGTLNISAAAVANICTNGTTIFASDGTYYDWNSSLWKSFIGSGTNLNSTDAARYSELERYCSSGLPIGVLQGSGQGPVYLLSPTDLIEIYPDFSD